MSMNQVIFLIMTDASTHRHPARIIYDRDGMLIIDSSKFGGVRKISKN